MMEYMQRKNAMRIATIVGAVLLIPLFGTIFIDGWNWGVFDFIAMGGLLFITGIALDVTSRKIADPTHRFIALSAIIVALICIWIELAVDGISQALSIVL